MLGMETQSKIISVKGVTVEAWKLLKKSARSKGRLIGSFLSELITTSLKDGKK
jgi:hypothetical protein